MQQNSDPGTASRLSCTTDARAAAGSSTVGVCEPADSSPPIRVSSTPAPSNPARSARRSCRCTRPPYPLCGLSTGRLSGVPDAPGPGCEPECDVPECDVVDALAVEACAGDFAAV